MDLFKFRNWVIWTVSFILILIFMGVAVSGNIDHMKKATVAEAPAAESTATEGGSGDRYFEGFNIGYKAGLEDGYDEGYDAGYEDAEKQRRIEEGEEGGSWGGTSYLEDAEEKYGSEEHIYVLNKSSMKFHYHWCGSVSQIADYNREDTYLSRQEIINMGYTPCKRCDP